MTQSCPSGERWQALMLYQGRQPDPERAAEPSNGVAGLRAVVIHEDGVVPPVVMPRHACDHADPDEAHQLHEPKRLAEPRDPRCYGDHDRDTGRHECDGVGPSVGSHGVVLTGPGWLPPGGAPPSSRRGWSRLRLREPALPSWSPNRPSRRLSQICGSGPINLFGTGSDARAAWPVTCTPAYPCGPPAGGCLSRSAFLVSPVTAEPICV
jgi:hypothetical protein